MVRLLTPVSALTFAAGLLLGAGCASGGGKPAAVPRVRPPAMLSTFRPDFRLSAIPRNGLVLDMQVEVGLDAAGRPDLETLRVTGLGAAENRDAVAVWLQSAQFQPAQQAGQAVPGVFRTRVMVRVTTTPIG